MLYIVGVKIKPLSKIRADLSLYVHATKLLLHMMVNLFALDTGCHNSHYSYGITN